LEAFFGDAYQSNSHIADDLLQVNTRLRLVAGQIFSRSFPSVVLAETGFNLDIRDLGDEQGGVAVREEVRRE
jgi:hypothetical protein